MNKNTIIAIFLVLLGAVLGFFGSNYYQNSNLPGARQMASASRAGRLGGQFGAGGAGFRNGMRPVTGDIISADDKSITVKMSDGSTKIVLISSTTSINKATKGVQSDLTVGITVGVFGTTNSDGSVTAQNIQINPVTRGISPTPTK